VRRQLKERAGLFDAIRAGWARDTSHDPARWTEANPAWGQCLVTALAVQDALGGDIVVGSVGRRSHYWNRLPDGKRVDLTRVQFDGRGVLWERGTADRARLLRVRGTATRYERLAGRLQAATDVVR